MYRHPAKPDYLLFVEHFADQAAYDAHTSSPAYRDLIASKFASMIVEFTELDHELVVGLEPESICLVLRRGVVMKGQQWNKHSAQ